jgi:hypothetical protein
MDLHKLIQDLYAERERLNLVITSLEELQRAPGFDVPSAPDLRKRRGRKSMDAAERLEVSERMKKYWSGRRKADDSPAGPAPDTPS